MRVLIISVTAGYGHNSTARAIADELESRGVDVVVEDLLYQFSQSLFGIVDKGYVFSVKHLRRPYQTAYSTLISNERMRRIVSAFSINDIIAHRFAGYISEFMPDVIVTTHVFAAQVINSLKVHGLLKMPVIGILTDYCIHPFWEEVGEIDGIVTSSELLSYAAAKRGIAPELLLPLGIPVRSAFLNTISKDEAKYQLGLDPSKRVILVMGGSMGYGNILSAVQSIDSLGMDLQIICICGKNEKLRQRLHYLKTQKEVLIRGFVDNVELYMDAADCIITKPGGLTITEVMCKELPMILMDPIPGHEVLNMEFLTNNGAAMSVGKSFSVAEAVYYLFSNPKRLELMRESIKLISKPRATQMVCDTIIDMKGNQQ